MKEILLLMIGSILLLFLNVTIFNNVIFKIIAILILITSIVLVSIKGKINKQLVIYYLLFIITLLFSFLFNYLKLPSFEGIFGIILTAFMLWLLLIDYEISEKNLIFINKIIYVISITTILLIITNLLGIYEIYFETRSNGYRWIFLNSNSLGVYLAFLIGYLIFFGRCYFSYIVIGILFIFLILSISRTSILIVLILLGKILFNYRKNYKVIISFILSVLGILIIILFSSGNYGEYLLSKGFSRDAGRFEIWKFVLSDYILKDYYSLFVGNGVTYGSFKEFDGLSAHNSYLQYFVKFGVVSFIFQLIYLFKILINHCSINIIIIYLSIFVAGLFESYMFYSIHPIWVGLIVFIFIQKNLKYSTNQNKNFLA